MNPTNALNEIPFVTSIKLQHVAALGWHPQGVKESRIKEYKFNMILYDSWRMAPQCQTCWEFDACLEVCLCICLLMYWLSECTVWHCDWTRSAFYIIIHWFIQFQLINSNLKLKSFNGLSYIFPCNVIKPMRLQHLTEIILPSMQNTFGICKLSPFLSITKSEVCWQCIIQF